MVRERNKVLVNSSLDFIEIALTIPSGIILTLRRCGLNIADYPTGIT